ncbi:MAG: DUF7352 domain-containing protein [Luminiphilus sp.]
MQIVFKYPFKHAKNTLKLPADAQPLTVGVQNHELVMWVQLDPDAAKVERQFRVFGTGESMPAEGTTYIGTTTTGPLVLHVFEIKEKHHGST